MSESVGGGPEGVGRARGRIPAGMLEFVKDIPPQAEGIDVVGEGQRVVQGAERLLQLQDTELKVRAIDDIMTDLGDEVSAEPIEDDLEQERWGIFPSVLPELAAADSLRDVAYIELTRGFTYSRDTQGPIPEHAVKFEYGGGLTLECLLTENHEVRFSVFGSAEAQRREQLMRQAPALLDDTLLLLWRNRTRLHMSSQPTGPEHPDA